MFPNLLLLIHSGPATILYASYVRFRNHFSRYIRKRRPLWEDATQQEIAWQGNHISMKERGPFLQGTMIRHLACGEKSGLDFNYLLNSSLARAQYVTVLEGPGHTSLLFLLTMKFSMSTIIQ